VKAGDPVPDLVDPFDFDGDLLSGDIPLLCDLVAYTVDPVGKGLRALDQGRAGRHVFRAADDLLPGVPEAIKSRRDAGGVRLVEDRFEEAIDLGLRRGVPQLLRLCAVLDVEEALADALDRHHGHPGAELTDLR